jgi:hypothetical protein
MALTTSNKDLVDAVRNWVHFDNIGESLCKQLTNARNMRSKYEASILHLLETSDMPNATIVINGGTLQKATRSKPGDLSWSFLEEQLHNFYKTKGKPDDTLQILDFLQEHRGTKIQTYIKKTAVKNNE